MPAAKRKPSAKPSSRKIDEEVEESFPASDPPAFVGGKRLIGAPKHRETPTPDACKPRQVKKKK